MTAEEGERWGYFNKIVTTGDLAAEAREWADRLSAGPTFANGMTKNQLNVEWDMSIDTAIEPEANAQAIYLQTRELERAYRAFVARENQGADGVLIKGTEERRRS